MLNIEKIDKYFGHNCLFKEATLLIHPNEKIGFIGPNGSGKTTLFRLIEETEELDGGTLSFIGKGVEISPQSPETHSSDSQYGPFFLDALL
jgi:ATPase subunit of ABC transporter with duplicated ATPase domains